MYRRLAAALTAATVLTAPVFATAAPPAPQIVDPSGDAVGGQAALDITSVRFSTSGTTTVTKVGKKKVKKTTYTPTKLVITQTLAAAPSTQAGARYVINADIAGCGGIDVYYVNGAEGPTGNVWLDCPEGSGAADGGTLIDMTPKIAGSTMTWELPLKMLPKEARVGALVSGFQAYTDIGDPVFGLLGTGDGASMLLNFDALDLEDPTNGVAVGDFASGSGTWKIG